MSYSLSEFLQELIDEPKSNLKAKELLESFCKIVEATVYKTRVKQDSNFVYGCVALPESEATNMDNLVLKLNVLTGRTPSAI